MWLTPRKAETWTAPPVDGVFAWRCSLCLRSDPKPAVRAGANAVPLAPKIICHPDVTGITREQVTPFVPRGILYHVLAPAPP